jgi:mitochondrial fission protein ELM1
LLGEKFQACVSNFPRFAVLLAKCDEFYVTADSVSMLAETMLTGKPVGMIPIRRSRRGATGHAARKLGVPLKSRADLSRFWSYLSSHKLVGSIEAPKASTVAATTQLAVEAVRNVMRPPPRPKIWALLGAHQGDNNQVLALAEAIGLPFERKQLTYNRWRHLGPNLLGASFRSLRRSSRASLSGDPPDLTISTGHRSVAPVQLLRERSGGTVRSIHVGYPRISPEKFDLVIATPEYPIHEHPNLLRIPFALTRKADRNELDAGFWDRHSAPRLLLILGGRTLYWELDEQALWEAMTHMLADATSSGGSVIVVGSPRTPQRLLAEAERRVRDAGPPAAFVPLGGRPSYTELLEQADTIMVTADSVAMVSDAIATGKPIGLIPLRPSRLGKIVMTVMDRLRPAEPLRPRDLRSFWRMLQHRGFAGTAHEPKCASVPDLNGLAAMRARAIFDKDGFSSGESNSAQ